MSHQPLPSARGATQSYAHEQEGLKQGLKPRQIQMIAMGGWLHWYRPLSGRRWSVARL